MKLQLQLSYSEKVKRVIYAPLEKSLKPSNFLPLLYMVEFVPATFLPTLRQTQCYITCFTKVSLLCVWMKNTTTRAASRNNY